MTLAEQLRRNREILQGDYTKRMSTRQTPTSTATVRRMPVKPSMATQGVGDVAPSNKVMLQNIQKGTESTGGKALEAAKKIGQTSLSSLGKGLQFTGNIIQEPARRLTGGRTFLEQAGAVGRGEVSPILGGPTATFKLGSALVGDTLSSFGKTLVSTSEKGPSAFDPSKVTEAFKQEGGIKTPLKSTLAALSTQEAENILNAVDIFTGGTAGDISKIAKTSTNLLEGSAFLLLGSIADNTNKVDDVIDLTKSLGKYEDLTNNLGYRLANPDATFKNVEFKTVAEDGTYKVTSQFRDDFRFPQTQANQIQRGIVNEVAESPWVPTDIRRNYNAVYTPKAGDTAFTEARNIIEQDYDGTLNAFKNGTLSPDLNVPVGAQLANKAFREGRDADGVEILDKMGEIATLTGRSNSYIQFLTRMTPEGMLRYAYTKTRGAAIKNGQDIAPEIRQLSKLLKDKNAQTIDQVISELDDKTLESLRREILEEAAEVGARETSKRTGTARTRVYEGGERGTRKPRAAKTPRDSIVQQLRDFAKGERVKPPKEPKTPEQILAEKVDNYLNKEPKTPEETEVIREMLNTLFKVAKESLPEKKRAGIDIDKQIETIANAITNREEYERVWKAAQKIVRVKYADSPSALRNLKEFNEKVLFPSYAVSDGDRLIKNLVKRDGTTLKQIARKSDAEIEQIARNYVNEIARRGGLLLDDKTVLEQSLLQRFLEIIEPLKPVVKEEKKPYEILVDKIEKYLKTKKKSKTPDPVVEMVDTLYKIAKGKIAKPKGEKVSRTEKIMEAIGRSVTNREEYVKNWNEARDLLKEKFADNPTFLNQLDNLTRSVLDPTFEPKDLDTAIKDLTKEGGISIAETVKQHYTKVDELGETLAEKLTNMAGVSPEDAKLIESYVLNRFNNLTKSYKQKELAKIFKDTTKKAKTKAPKDLMQNLVEWSNLGAFQEADLYEKIAGKLKIPHMTKALAKDIYERMNVYQEVMDMPLPSKIDQDVYKQQVRAAIVKNVYEDIQRQNPLTWGEKLTFYQRANLLSRVSTQSGNLYTGLKATLVDIPASKALSGQIKDLPTYYKKVFSSIPSAVEDFKISFNGGVLTNPDFKDVRLNLIKDNRALHTIGTSLRLMEGIDKFFTRLIIEGTDKPELADYFLKRARPDSKNLQQGAVLRFFDRATESLYALRGRLGTPGHVLIPFLQYGSNVFKQKLEFSPLGFLPWFQTKDGLQNGRALLGTIHMLNGFNKAFNGDIILEAPRGEREKKQFYGEGKIPYSIRYTLPDGKDYYIPLAYGEQFEPLYIFAGTFAKRWDELKGLPAEDIMDLGQKMLDTFTTAGSETATQMGKTTGLATLNRSVGVLTGDPALVEQGVTSLASGFVPVSGLQDSINSLFDKTVRQRNNLKGQLIGSIPGLSQNLEPYTGLYGEESKKRIGQAIIPYGISRAEDEYAYTTAEQAILKEAESSEQTQKILIDRAKKEVERTGMPQRVGEIEIKMYQGKPTEFKVPSAALKLKTQSEITETTQRAEEETAKLQLEGNVNNNLVFYLDRSPNNEESARVVANLYKKDPEVLNYLLDRDLLTDKMVNRVVLENAREGDSISKLTTRLEYLKSQSTSDEISSQGADLLLDAYNEKIISAEEFNQIVVDNQRDLSDTAKRKLIGDVSVDTLIKQNANQDQRGEWLVSFLQEVRTDDNRINSSTMDYIIKLNTNNFINKDTLIRYIGRQRKTESAQEKYDKFIERIE